jgi:Ca-activated chloride channel family protein
VANVGRTGADDILKQIKRYADKGITLTSVGFGMGNYNDILLEKLGNKGNGHYAYVDNLAEARRIFVGT